ncbi:histidine kinase OS=Streptomyces cyaneofuscatus OX=66883 GN=G3I52_18765 PE=4 SV=1 [Streptomyces cyaneofuscatus]
MHSPGMRPSGMHSSGLWRPLRRRDYVISARPWRAALYLLTSVPLGAATLLTLVLLAVAGSALAVVLVGLPLLLVLALSGIPLASLERRRLRLVDSTPLADPHREPPGTGLAAWLRTRLQERSTWRELGYALLFATVLWPLEALAVGAMLLVCGGLMTTPAVMAAGGDGEAKVLKLWIADSYPEAFAVLAAGVLLLPVLAYPLGALAAGRAVLTRQLLSVPESGADSRLQELDRSRMRRARSRRSGGPTTLRTGAERRSAGWGLARLEGPAEPLGGLLAKARGRPMSRWWRYGS